MPRELSASEEREFDEYRRLGALEDVRSRLGKLPKVQSEAKQHRERIDALEKENEALKAKAPDGAVVLTGDDAAAHKAITESGMTLKQVQDGLKERDDLKAEKQRRDREDVVRSVAKAEGLDPDNTVKAFANLAGADTLSFETGEVKPEGKTEKVPAGFVVKADGTKSRLSEWISAEHPYLNLASSGTDSRSGTQGNGGVREIPPLRGNSSSQSSEKKTVEDYGRSVTSTADYTL